MIPAHSVPLYAAEWVQRRILTSNTDTAPAYAAVFFPSSLTAQRKENQEKLPGICVFVNTLPELAARTAMAFSTAFSSVSLNVIFR